MISEGQKIYLTIKKCKEQGYLNDKGKEFLKTIEKNKWVLDLWEGIKYNGISRIGVQQL